MVLDGGDGSLGGPVDRVSGNNVAEVSNVLGAEEVVLGSLVSGELKLELLGGEVSELVHGHGECELSRLGVNVVLGDLAEVVNEDLLAEGNFTVVEVGALVLGLEALPEGVLIGGGLGQSQGDS